MAPTRSQKRAYRDTFRSLSRGVFQSWFEGLARALHPPGDFQSIHNTRGDGGLDGIVISQRLVYQVYAPPRLLELRDGDVAAKMKADFNTAQSTLGGQLQAWNFVHNHPAASIGHLTAAAIFELRTANPDIEFKILDIDSLWDLLVSNLPDESFNKIFPEDEASLDSIAKDVSDQRLRGSATRILGLLLPAVSSLPLELLTDSLVSPPSALPVQLAPRNTLVARLGAVLSETRQLVLTGSFGMGKSILAKLLMSDGWLWAGLKRDGKSENLMTLQILRHRLQTEACPLGVVFDNFEPEQLDGAALSELLHLLELHAIQFVITTTATTLPLNVAASVSLPAISVIPVPAFTLEETKEFLGACRCPADRLSTLAGLLDSLTSGHPQLLHARVKDLVGTAWQVPSIEQAFLVPRSVEEIQDEARRLLRRGSSQDTRILAYRLSLLTQPFRRDQALAIGAITPNIALPGESFDLLNGPWIEPLAGSRFQVSPLLSAAAENIWSASEIKNLHRSIAEVLLNTVPRTLSEAIGGFDHSFLGEDEENLLHVAVSLIMAERRIKQAFFPFFRAFSYAYDEGPMPAFIARTNALILRMFQYQIAKEPEQKKKIVARWDKESRTVVGEDRPPAFYRLQFTGTVLMDYEFHYKIPQLFGWLREASDAGDEAARQDPESQVGPLWLDIDSLEGVGLAGGLFLFVLARCANIEDLFTLSEQLARLEEVFRNRCFEIFDSTPGLASYVVDHCWSKESKDAEPAWLRCLDVLKHLERYAELWRREDLRQATVRAQSIILHEFQGDTEGALELLRRSRGTFSNALLDDQEASLIQEQGDHLAAWAIWHRGLSVWALERQDTTMLAFASKKAAISAGHLEKWDEAAALFLSAANFLESAREDNAEPCEASALSLTTVALFVDHAFALWKAGQRADSIRAFEIVLSRLQEAGEAIADLDDCRVLRKMLGAILLWAYRPGDQEGLYPGVASAQKSNLAILDLPPTSIEQLWALLCNVESSSGDQSRILDRTREVLSASEDQQVVFLFRRAEYSHALRIGQVDMLAETTIALGAAMSAQFNARAIAQEMLFGLMSLTHHNPEAKPPWARWRKDIEAVTTPERSALDSWMKVAEEIFSMSVGEVQAALRGIDGRHDMRFLLIAVRFATGRGFPPENVFLAQLILVTIPGLDSPEGELICAAIEESWRRLLKNPASLLAPRLNSPAICAACDSQRAGLAKAAMILLAAEPAVRVPIPEARRRLLKSLLGEHLALA
jgi:hypothetical protein